MKFFGEMQKSEICKKVVQKLRLKFGPPVCEVLDPLSQFRAFGA